MTISPGLINQMVQRGEVNEIMDDDVIAFMANPRLWRPAPTILDLTLALETAQAFWQDVYDELGIKVEVPPVPKLTDKQVKSLKKFGFMLVYEPAITEAQYPAGFVKPNWGEPFRGGSNIEHLPLVSQWVAVETITQPNYGDPKDYAEDVLMAAVKHPKRFATSYRELMGGLLARIAKTTGFPKKGTRLLSVEERSFIGSMFNWLREHRQMDLPDLASARSWEWCANAYGSGGRFIAGYSDRGGLADVSYYCLDRHYDSFGFRVLAVL